MKKFLLFVFLAAAYLNSSAQNVGIGTNTPLGKLDIRHNSTSASPTLLLYDNGALSFSRIQFQNASGNKYWQLAGNMNNTKDKLSRIQFSHSVNGDFLTLTGEGNLGIGTIDPTEKLSLENGQIYLNKTSTTDSNSIIFNMPSPTPLGSTTQGIKFQSNGNDKAFISYTASSLVGFSTLKLSATSKSANDLTISNVSGNVGINKTGASEKLEVVGNALVSDGGSIFLDKTDGTRTVEIKSSESGTDGSSILLYNRSGVNTIELDGDFADGDGRVITSELQINGGSDLAEKFDVLPKNEVAALPGMLVSIDAMHEGKLCVTHEAGDKKLVGVVSGANGIKPGMLMGQDESIANGKFPIALAGRVYVYANEEGGEILPGDFLTSAKQTGYAKKVEDVHNMQGAIIGKAMGKRNPENGFVLVLINLQ